jgi:hypothetical protein
MPIITFGICDVYRSNAFQAPLEDLDMSAMMHQMQRVSTASGVDGLEGLSRGLASRTTPPPGD